ncbi:MAG: hypothetical protein ACFB10_03105 [Salibacteraceae bacterium]
MSSTPEILDDFEAEPVKNKLRYRGSHSDRSIRKIPLTIFCLVLFWSFLTSVLNAAEWMMHNVFICVLSLTGYLTFSIWGTINGYLAVVQKEPFLARYFGLVINGLFTLLFVLVLVVGIRLFLM